jgi:hypothetical protein
LRITLRGLTGLLGFARLIGRDRRTVCVARHVSTFRVCTIRVFRHRVAAGSAVGRVWTPLPALAAVLRESNPARPGDERQRQGVGGY